MGFRVKSGRAVGVVLTGSAERPTAVRRCEIELSDPSVQATRQPYHDGFGTAQANQAVIDRLVGIIERCAQQSVSALLKADGVAGQSCRGAALVVGSVIDPAAVANPHIRAHASEGRLFRTVLENSLRAHGIACTVIVEKQLAAQATARLEKSRAQIDRTMSEFGRALGSPWRADEKAAAQAAWLALL